LPLPRAGLRSFDRVTLTWFGVVPRISAMSAGLRPAFERKVILSLVDGIDAVSVAACNLINTSSFSDTSSAKAVTSS
jgi:hypothetical protein